MSYKFLNQLSARRVEVRTPTLRVGKGYLLIAAILSTTPSFCEAAAESPESAAAKLQEILTIAEWSTERFSKLAAQPKFSPEDYRQLASLNRTLKRINPLLANAANNKPANGHAIQFTGTVTSVEAIDHNPTFYRCQITANQPAPTNLEIITPKIPEDWLKLNLLVESTVVTGIYIAGSGSRSEIIVSPRVAWFPSKIQPNIVNFGETILGSAGYDVGLLDDVVDAQSILSRESKAFYELLETANQFGANQLIRFADGNINRFSQQWTLLAEQGGKDPLVAKVVASQAKKGQYSVAPLFNDARRQRGNLFVFDGLVRRAVRVTVDSDRYPFDHYYELELFTADSQNLPLVCCVRELPKGFPQGDSISQDARIAGFLFKRWAYRTRKPTDSDDDKQHANLQHDRRQLAPLLIGRAPVMLLPAPSASRRAWEIGGGITFAAILLLIWLLLTRQSKNDQSFRQSLRNRFEGHID